jgi:DEAD/DEAH box helicase domain-containing protein
VGALLLMCDPHDLGVALTDKSGMQGPMFEPDLHLYDTYPGGIGQSEPLYQMNAQLLSGARDLISSCGCESGCPSCVGPAGETGSKAKESALRILDALLDTQRPALG